LLLSYSLVSQLERLQRTKELSLETISSWADSSRLACLFEALTLCDLFFLLMVLGAGKPKIQIAKFCSSLYWAYWFVMPFIVLWWTGMVFMPEKLMENYGITDSNLGSEARKMISAAFTYAFGPIYIMVFFIFKAQFITADTYYTYIYNRVLAMLFFGGFLSGATGIAAWDVLNSKGDYDKVIDGQKFNLAWSFITTTLFYVPIAMMDKDVITLEVVKKTRGVKGKAVEETEDADAEPLLPEIPPLVPLTASPTYESYAVPATGFQYAPQYVMPAQQYAPQAYAYAPTTTAYAPTAYTTAAPVYATSGTAVYQ